MTPISTLPLDELVMMYQNAYILWLAKKRNPYLFMWQLTSLEVDMDLLYTAMVPKIPDSHLLAIKLLIHDTKHD